MTTRRILAKALAPLLLTAGLTGAASTAALVTSAGPASACGPGDPVPAYARSRPVQRLGDHGVWTYAVQTDLHDRGRHITPTGSFDRHTKRVVARFQRAHHLRASGVVTRRTWVALIGDYQRGVVWPAAVRHIPDFPVHAGDRGRHVFVLENALERAITGKDLRTYEKYAGETYNRHLVRLVKRFQRRTDIKASGIVGTKTWTKLYEVVSATGHWGC